jgi:hypothetical protein
MKQEKQINLSGYLRSKSQENYYKQMRENILLNQEYKEYSNFEIDLYNMGINNLR